MQAALSKRQLQVSELRARLLSARDNNECMGQQLSEKDAAIRHLETRMMEYKELVDNA